MEFKTTLKSFLESKQYLKNIDTEKSFNRFPTEARLKTATHQELLNWYKFLPKPSTVEQTTIFEIIKNRIEEGDGLGKLNTFLSPGIKKVMSPNTNESVNINSGFGNYLSKKLRLKDSVKDKFIESIMDLKGKKLFDSLVLLDIIKKYKPRIKEEKIIEYIKDYPFLPKKYKE